MKIRLSDVKYDSFDVIITSLLRNRLLLNDFKNVWFKVSYRSWNKKNSSHINVGPPIQRHSSNCYIFPIIYGTWLYWEFLYVEYFYAISTGTIIVCINVYFFNETFVYIFIYLFILGNVFSAFDNRFICTTTWNWKEIIGHW